MAGLPEMVSGATTLIENGARETVDCPSLTLIVMFEVVPTAAGGGVPFSRPEAASKLAQSGMLAIENVSESPSASEAVGRKAYPWPAVTLVAGVPEICGGVFVSFCVGPDAGMLVPEPPVPDPTPTDPHAVSATAIRTLMTPTRRKRNASEPGLGICSLQSK